MAEKEKKIVSKLDEGATETINVICPHCGNSVPGHKCTHCGAEKCINQVSFNEIWLLGGRVIAAFEDSRIAYIKMASRHRIPSEQWPQEFRTREEANVNS